ncbi:glycosyltransferase family 1 protein [Clostridium sp. DJ247]|uniref:glycosyltransferase family 4 protein n=1 Tax=Clostridium sp. DJ247 TaxID=2726188 RepID=UPI00162A5DF8|nr:glycosyltransferase family 1 protein [Clostridium sp. DJ247]MBC2581568.1 glycosyltransferase family 4 protein [Clostridium sp. DJ247]
MKVSLELQPILKAKSGVGWYTYNIIKELISRNIELNGQVFNFLGRNDVQDSIKDLNINIETCKAIPYGVYRRMWNYVPVPYDILFKTRSDINHFFNFIIPPGIKGKTIVTIHDMVHKKFPETMTKANLKRLNNDLERSANRADLIITVSENSKKEIMQYLNIEASKIKIVPPGIDESLYSMEFTYENINYVREKYNLPQQYFLYLGTLEPRKNIESIIEAFALYKKKNKDNIKLVIAGGKGWGYESIFNKVEKHSLTKEIIFTGYVDEKHKAYLYKMAKAFLFPSLYEGFGMPVLEAMALGVPVITSNTSSITEVCGNAAILVEPKDIEAIVSGMELLSYNEDFSDKLISEGLEQSKKFTWKRSVDTLVEIYIELGER